MSCREPELLIYHEILGGEEDFAQCFHVEQRNHVTSEGKTLHECNFHCKNFCVNSEVSLFVRMQLMRWRHGFTHSPKQLCGITIQE